MTNFYAGNLNNSNQPIFNERRFPTTQLTLFAGMLGATAGAVCGSLKKQNLVNSDGMVNDTFTKRVYEKYVKKTNDEELKFFEKQRIAIMDKIKKVSKVEDLKNLINENKDLVDKIVASSGEKAEEFASGIKWYTLGRKKKNIMKGVENAYEMRLDKLGNEIAEFWNATTKKFEKGSGASDELYSVIKRTKNGMKLKQILKSAGICGAITAAGTLALVKLFDVIQKNRTVGNPVTSGQ